VLNPGTQLSTIAAQGNYVGFKQQLDQLQTDRKQIETVLARTKAGAQTVDAFQTIPAVQKASDLMKALGELSTLEGDLRALLYRYTDQYRGVQDDKAKIEKLKTQTIPEMAQALVDQLKIQESDLESKIGQAGSELKSVPEQQMALDRLMRDKVAKEELFKSVASQFEATKLAAVSEVPDLQILDTAVVPRKPASNTAPKIILMALGASLGLGVGLALLLDQLDRRFRYPEQITRELGLSILGAIPAIRKVRGAELQPEEASQVVEAFRSVRLNLAHSFGPAGPVMLTVSSPGAGDGKSLVASNLAVSFAEAGYRTLLIDGDIRRGELHRMFSIDRRPGLLDYLSGGASADEIVRPSSQRGLTVIPCGTRRHQGPELLGSTAMSKLMTEMKSRFNVIIMDSPPLGAGIDPFVLGTATGHIMIVMRSGETDRTMAEAKLKLLDRLPIRVLGAVLNDIQAEGIYRYYSYLYGYTADEEQGAPQLVGKVEGVSPET
jgi:capsular exopolysaccharide synthesis family protein